MEQPQNLGSVRGAASDDAVDVRDLAIEVWGDKAAAANAGLAACAYLWRRFGPPFYGSDDYKEILQYILTTDDPDVWLTVYPGGSGLRHGVGYLATPALRRRAFAEPDMATRIQDAIRGAMRELLRPVGVRDTMINLFGRLLDDCYDYGDVADRSAYAGYPVPRDAMDALRREAD